MISDFLQITTFTKYSATLNFPIFQHVKLNNDQLCSEASAKFKLPKLWLHQQAFYALYG